MSPDFSITPATDNDLSALVELLQRCAADMHEQGMSHWLEVYDKQSVQDNLNSKQVFKLTTDGRLVGCVALSQTPSAYYQDCWPQAATADFYITQLAVDPDFQSQGLGRRLMQFCLQQTHDYELQLDAVAHYPTLLQFYQQLGFEIIAEGIGLGDYRYLLRCKIPAA